MKMKDYSIPEINTLEEVYHYLDENIKTTLDAECISDRFYRCIDKFNEEERKTLKIILEPLFLMLKRGVFRPMIEMKDKDGNQIFIPNIDTFNDSYAAVLKKRISSSKNLFIKARYAHTVWHITKNIDYAKIAVDSYLSFIDICEELDKQGTEEFAGLEVVSSFENAASLAIPTKYNIEGLKQKALYLLFKYFPSSSDNNLIKITVIKFLMNYTQKGLFKKELLNGAAEICEEYRLKASDSYWALDFIEYGRKIANILKQDNAKWDINEAEFYELLMKKEGQELVAPEYCQKALKIYKKLNLQNKIEELSAIYPELTKALNLQSFESDPIDLSGEIERYKNLAKEFTTEQIISFLLNCSNIPDYEGTRSSAEEITKNLALAHMSNTTILDKFGNTKGVITTEEEYILYYIFSQYSIYSDMTANFLTAFINECILQKKLNSKILIEYLKTNSWFGYNLIFQVMNNQNYKYKWLDFIEPSITSYFLRLEKSLIDNENEYPLFIQEIDCLTLKIEGMVRDLVRAKNMKNFSIYKFTKSYGVDTVSLKDINTLLWDKNIFEVLPKDDVWFLRYFLIDSFNLRNDIAHSLYLSPKEYNIHTMNLVLIAILRLSRFRLKSSE